MEAHVTVHLAGQELPAILSTSHATASYGQPVLLLEGGPSYPEREPVAHGRFPTMTHSWLYSAGWADGSSWHQDARSLVDELDRAPLHREVVRHVVAQEEDPGTEGASWTFRDGSGVVEVGERWDVFDPEGRTGAGQIVR